MLIYHFGSPSMQHPDNYILSDPNLVSDRHDAYYVPGQIVTFQLQKYRFEPSSGQFELTKLWPILIDLQIQRYAKEHRKDDSSLPYRLDGVCVGHELLSAEHQSDPIFSALDYDYQFSFRFSSWYHMGCLVHYGFDVAACTQSPDDILWRSAVLRDYRLSASQPK